MTATLVMDMAAHLNAAAAAVELVAVANAAAVELVAVANAAANAAASLSALATAAHFADAVEAERLAAAAFANSH